MPKDVSFAGAIGRLALYGLFATTPRFVFDLETHGLEFDTCEPRTLYAMTHKRDIDGMTPVPPILTHRGWRGLTSEVHFALRSDAFERGFLARMVPHPRWFSLLLRPLSVGPLLRGIGVHPLRDLHVRPAEAWLREALAAEGDRPAGELFTSAFLTGLAVTTRQNPDTLATMPRSRLLNWRYHLALQPTYGPEIFLAPARRRAERRVLKAAMAYLDDVAAWLRHGGSIFSAPEGGLSPDGHLSPVSGGAHRILRASPPETRVLPVALVYDFMTTARPRLFVDLAPPIERAPALSWPELSTALRDAWLRASRFTCSQLASGILVERTKTSNAAITTDELASALCSQANQLASNGRHVDKRLLAPNAAHHLASRYLRFAQREGIVRRANGETWRIATPVQTLHARPGEVGYRSAPLAYAYNELSDLLSVS